MRGRQKGLSRVFKKESSVLSFLGRAFEQVVKKGVPAIGGLYVGYHTAIVTAPDGTDPYANTTTGMVVGAILAASAVSPGVRSYIYNAFKFW